MAAAARHGEGARQAETRVASMADASAAAPEPIACAPTSPRSRSSRPACATDANGRAQVPVKLPDNLTRYRVMAVAVAGATSSFGSGESTLTARLPLMVRPSAPRFLNFGDRFELPVVVQNQTDARADGRRRGARDERGAHGGRGPARDGARATTASRCASRPPRGAPGTARFQVGAASGTLRRRAPRSSCRLDAGHDRGLRDLRRRSTRARSRSRCRRPPDVVPQFGGLEVTTSSTRSRRSPTRCSTSSRIRSSAPSSSRRACSRSPRCATCSTRSRPRACRKPDELDGRGEARPRAAAARCRTTTAASASGGAATSRGRTSAIHVAHALERAQGQGLRGARRRCSSARTRYLREIERAHPGRIRRRRRGARSSPTRSTCAHRMGDARRRARARTLVREAAASTKLSLEALGWLLPVLVGRRGVAGRGRRRSAATSRTASTETAGAAHFATSLRRRRATCCCTRTAAPTAILLEALIADQPKSDLIPKLVAGLLGHRKAGRWENTQENAFVLLALDRYFQTYEKATPDFVARVWLGDALRRRARVPGPHDRAPATSTIPMAVARRAPGRRRPRRSARRARAGSTTASACSYAPHEPEARRRPTTASPSSAPTRPSTSPSDVRRDADGTWRIKAGARVRVRADDGRARRGATTSRSSTRCPPGSRR